MKKALIIVCVLFAGCATKKDLKNVRLELVALQMRQDSLFKQLYWQSREILDSLRAGSELTVRARGDLGHELSRIQQQVARLEELVGQTQRRMAELQLASEQQPAGAGRRPAPASPDGEDAEELYTLGVEQLQSGAASTARQAFQQFLTRFPTHARAADAQFQLAETYVVEEQRDAALREFARVAERYPSSSRAPTSLYRAALLAEELGNISAARGYLQQVVGTYPNTDEARLARERLSRLR